MRRPTCQHEAHAWWREALVNPRLPRQEGFPQPGYYARRYVRGGPLVPVRVWLDQDIDPDTGDLADDERIRAEELGASKDAALIWTHLRPITAEAYRDLVASHERDAFMSATHVPIDLTQTPMRP
jgi:hypothetical protein